MGMMVNDEDLGAALRRLREDAGLTQTELAESVGGGMTKVMLLQREAGNVRISADELFAFAAALRIDPLDVLAEAWGEVRTDPLPVHATLTRTRAELERVSAELAELERALGREALASSMTSLALAELEREGAAVFRDGRWYAAEHVRAMVSQQIADGET